MKIISGLLLIFGFLFFSIQAQESEKEEVIRVQTNLVSVPVVVSDRQGRYVAGLKQADFSLFQDGKQKEISFFATNEEPMNVAILLDTSRSTEFVLDEIKDAAKDFIKLLQPNDQAMIVTFDADVNVIQNLTSNQKDLEKAIKKVEIGDFPGTVMRDAVFETVSRSLAAAKGRKAIILLTDGKDFGSYPTQNELLRTLEESDVMIYPIFFKTSFFQQRQIFNRRGRVFGGGRRMGGNFPRRRPNNDRVRNRDERQNQFAMEYLQKMSELTAGRFYEEDGTNLKKTFAIIADELRKQYRIGFYPENVADKSAVYEIKVKVSRPEVSVRSRNSFRIKQ